MGYLEFIEFYQAISATLTGDTSTDKQAAALLEAKIAEAASPIEREINELAYRIIELCILCGPSQVEKAWLYFSSYQAEQLTANVLPA